MRRTRAIVVSAVASTAAASLALTALPVDAATRGVRVSQTTRMPASGVVAITGHGYGHGHGMSQYGAQGAALRGLSAAQILAFYYPGTTTSTYTGNVAVLLTRDTDNDTQIVAGPGQSVKDRGTGKVFRLPSQYNIERWRLAVSGTRTIVQWYGRRYHQWHTTTLGGSTTFVGDGEFAATSAQLQLITPSGTKAYRGTLRSSSPSAGSSQRDTVNVLSIDNYLRGVVPAEMPASWSPAAVQAQSVAARSYALRSRADNLSRYYQICDTTSCQVYGGVASENSLSDKAIQATAGRYLSYDGKPAFTQFSSSSGGWTSAGSVAYLAHKSDPYDAWSGNKMHTWTGSIDETALERKFPAIGDVTSITITQREGDGDWGGRVLSMTITGVKGSRTMSGNDFRALYRLRSNWFNLG